MKNLMIFLVLALSSLGLSATDGIAFLDGSPDNLFEKAAHQDKLIFVDFYASWCAPCKELSTTTFTDPDVAQFMNEAFINIKVDVEKTDPIFSDLIEDIESIPQTYSLRPNLTLNGRQTVFYQWP